ncbi:MAG TPA: OmpA family protein [Cyclobacteriaceae bacterium]|nr:OmpA family protein [Cyclobacteriaceae bacterium]
MKLVTPVILVAIILVLISCGGEKKMTKAFKMGKYEKVIDYYSDVLQKEPNNSRANYYIAESFRRSNRIKLSEPFYQKAVSPTGDEDSVKLYYAKALQANGKYNEAKAAFSELEASTSSQPMKKRVSRELAGLQGLEKLNEKETFYRIKNLEALNTQFTEYGPSYLNGELYFTSSRANSRIYEQTGTPFTDLYKVETKGANVDVATIKALPEIINDSNINEGCITFTPDGRTMVFAKGNTGKKKGAEDVDLYIARFRNGSWGDSKTGPTPININTPKNWESTPAFSPDGRTLYFASNRPGGFGGLDIYSAQMDSRGRFGRVKNLGAEINTPGDEMFPYVAENGKMYFSSDGHSGYGQLDIFVVNRANGKTVIDNLGQPINSTGDDFGIFLFRPDRGFFTSNREGGKGDDDIYTFVNEDPNLRVINYYLQGITYTTKSDSTREILPETRVTLLDQSGNVMQDFTTGNDGKFLFRVYENETYTLLGETDGYIAKRQSFTTNGKSIPLTSVRELVTNITLDTLMVLDKKIRDIAFQLKNIHFGLDSSNINSASARELDKLVELLNDNPDITKIELSSHTDSTASRDYNIQLSTRRAQSTRAYLIKKGIDADRIEAKGYGEDRPIARNTNRDGSDNPEGRARNRRTEFRILQMGAIKEKDVDDEFDEDKFFKNELKKGKPDNDN